MAAGKYKEWLTEEGLQKLKAYARDGLLDEQIAKKMAISPSTLYEWKKKYSEISEALKYAKEIPDLEVEDSLFKKATGYKVTVKKAFKVKEVKYKDGKKVSEKETIKYADEEIYIPADTLAQIFWLKNRKPEIWRDKVEHVDPEDKTLTVVFSKEMEKFKEGGK